MSSYQNPYIDKKNDKDKKNSKNVNKFKEAKLVKSSEIKMDLKSNLLGNMNMSNNFIKALKIITDINNENEQWVACDSGKLECPGDGWYHYKCIPELQKYTFDIINKEIDKYYCPDCRKMFGLPNTLENYEKQKKIKENNNEKNKENEVDKMDIEEDEPDENYYQIDNNCDRKMSEEK